jgi:hypothetical protein
VFFARATLQLGCCLTLALPVFGAPGFRVGDLWIVDTSVPDVLQSQTLQAPPELTASGKLQYEIGFSTRERVDLGFLFDSLTVAVASADGSGAVNLFTADVFGLSLMPFSPTGLLGNGAITARPTSLRTSLLDNPTVSFAYAVEVTLPPALAGTELRTTFNFFNNGDDVPTQSYATLIPEPSTLALLSVGGAFCWWVIYQKRTRK